MKNLQKTVKEPIEIEGVGLHNGIKVNLCIKPAEVNSGIRFKRTDVDEAKNIIEASYKNVSSPVLCTKIKNSYGVTVSTIEHLMATFYGEGIDNVLVEIDAPEVPIMDGSAFDFVTAIRSFGVQEQNYAKKFIKVLKKIEVKDGLKHISIEPLTKDLIIDFEIPNVIVTPTAAVAFIILCKPISGIFTFFIVVFFFPGSRISISNSEKSFD